MSAIYYSRGESIDYTPEADVNAGDIVVIGDLVCVAKLDIKAGELGALATCGVYRVSKASGAITAGAKVYVTAEGVATATEGSNKLFGTAIAGAGADDTEVIVLLNK